MGSTIARRGRVRRRVWLAGALGASVCAPWAVSAQHHSDPVRDSSGAVEGVVEGRLAGTRQTLHGVSVRAWGDGWRGSVQTDSLGRYSIEEIPAGEVRVQAIRPGYAPLELVVTIPGGGRTTLDLEMEAVPIPLASLRVPGSRIPESDPDGPDENPAGRVHALGDVRSELDRQALGLGPGIGQAGVVEALQGLPGQDPSGPGEVLFLRGSATDFKLILLDGVPVFTPFHVAGLLPAFEPTLLESAELHVGGAPARYDGGLTHILEIETRTARPERPRASGSADLLSASLAVETPLADQTGLLVSGRTLHGAGEAALGAARPYGYRDGLAILDTRPAPGHEIRATVFANEEAVLLDFPGLPDDARWSNRAGVVRYTRDLDGATLITTAGTSGYRASLPLQSAPAPGVDTPTTVLATADTRRARFQAELAWGPPAGRTRTGFMHERTRASFRATSLDTSARSLAGGDTRVSGAFFDTTRPLVPGVTLRGGVRADHFSTAGWRWAPRGSVMIEVGPDALLSVTAGRYHQPLLAGTSDLDRTLAEVVEGGAGAEGFLPVASADHLVVSLDQRFGSSVALGLEGFWKRYRGVFGEGSVPVLNSGMEVRVLGTGPAVSGWFGYGLSWFWSETDLSGNSAAFAGRHLLNAGVTGRLLGPIHGEVRASYGAGLPGTSVPVPGPVQDEATITSGGPTLDEAPSGNRALRTRLDGSLDDPFLRVDLEIHARFRPRWGGRVRTIRPYLRLINALDRRDGLFFAFQPWRPDTLQPLAERPFLPLLGVTFSF